MSSLDIADRLRPQDGRARVAVNGVPVDLRVSTLPAQLGEKVVIRILDSSRIVFEGLDQHEHWNEVILQETGVLDDDRIRAEVTEAARGLIARDPAIGAFLFECSDLPPYSAAVHAATGLPVFDWAGFIRYVHDAVVPRSYHGTF